MVAAGYRALVGAGGAGVNAQDAFAIRALRNANHDDTWWACDVVLRADGAAVVVPLTVARLEAVVRLLYEEPRHPRVRAHYSMPPTEAVI